MQASKRTLSICCATAIVAITIAFPDRLPAQTAPAPTSAGSSAAQVSVQVERVNPADLGLAPSFQLAIYESLLQELNKTKRFKQVLREGDRKASEIPNLLVLKTTIVQYTPGGETRRAVTTISGATKLTVRSQLLTADGKVVLDRTVNGNVRFFGSNLRATHNLAKNIAKAIKKSSWSLPGQPS
jgi:hypothetical protein